MPYVRGSAYAKRRCRRAVAGGRAPLSRRRQVIQSHQVVIAVSRVGIGTPDRVSHRSSPPVVDRCDSSTGTSQRQPTTPACRHRPRRGGLRRSAASIFDAVALPPESDNARVDGVLQTRLTSENGELTPTSRETAKPESACRPLLLAKLRKLFAVSVNAPEPPSLLSGLNGGTGRSRSQDLGANRCWHGGMEECVPPNPARRPRTQPPTGGTRSCTAGSTRRS